MSVKVKLKIHILIQHIYFDDDGNITGEYAYTEDTGIVRIRRTGINPYMGDGGMSYIKGSDNRLINHNFTSLAAWNEEKRQLRRCNDIIK